MNSNKTKPDKYDWCAAAGLLLILGGTFTLGSIPVGAIIVGLLVLLVAIAGARKRGQ